jgi:tight adherence protein B
MLLLIAFTGVLLLSFCIIIFVMQPSSDQKAVERRIAGIEATSTAGRLYGGSLKLLKAGEASAFGWLEDLLKSYHFSERIQLRILQAQSKTTPGTLILSSIGLFFCGFFLTYLFLPVVPVALMIGFATGSAHIGWLSFHRQRRIDAFNNVLADSIDIMGRALRAGHSMTAAIGIVAEQAPEPVKTEFGEVFKKQNYGLPLRDALMQLLDRVPSQDLRVLITGILVQKDTGGNLAEILDHTVFVIRERIRIQGEIRVHTAQGRLTGWILCLLPIIMLILINMTSPGYSRVLFETPMGHKLLYSGIGLLFTGGVLMRQIIKGIEV